MKKLLAIALALVMALTLLPNAWAEGDKEGNALPTAFRNDGGGVYTLTEDVTLSAPLQIHEGENWTVNLNGHRITADTAVYESLGGIITINGPGNMLTYSVEDNVEVETFTRLNEKSIETYFSKTETDENVKTIYIVKKDENGEVLRSSNSVAITEGNKIYVTVTIKDADGNVTSVQQSTNGFIGDAYRCFESTDTFFNSKGDITRIYKNTCTYNEQGITEITTVMDAEGNVLRSTEYFKGKNDDGKSVATNIEKDSKGNIIEMSETVYEEKGSENSYHSISTTTTKDSEGNITRIVKDEYFRDTSIYITTVTEFRRDKNGSLTRTDTTVTTYEEEGSENSYHITSTTTTKDSKGNITRILKNEHFQGTGIYVTTLTEFQRDKDGNLTRTDTTVTTRNDNTGKTITEEVQKYATGEEKYRKVTTEEGNKKTWEATGKNIDWKKVTWVGETITFDDGKTVTHEVVTWESDDGVVTIDDVRTTVVGNRTTEIRTEKDAAGNVSRITETVRVEDGEKRTCTITWKDAAGNISQITETVQVEEGEKRTCTTTLKDSSGNIVSVDSSVEETVGGKYTSTSVTTNAAGKVIRRYEHVSDEAAGTFVEMTTYYDEGISTKTEGKTTTEDGVSVTETIGVTTNLNTKAKTKRESKHALVEATGVYYGSMVEMPGDMDVSVTNLYELARKRAMAGGGFFENLDLTLSETVDAASKSAITVLANGETLQFLNVDLTENGTQMADLDTPLAITVKADTAGKNITVYRVHDGMAESFRRTTSEKADVAVDGTFYVGDGYVTIFASKFSAYAIGTAEKTTTPNHRDETNQATATAAASGGKATSATTFDAGVGIYAVGAILSVTGMAWVGKNGRKKS